MGRSLFLPTNIPLSFSGIPRLRSPPNLSHGSLPLSIRIKFKHGFQIFPCSNTKEARTLCTRAVLSEIPNQKQYPKMGAQSTGPIAPSRLIQVAETAASTGAQVVMDAVNKPQSITYKGLTDLVTDTDKMSEAAILEVVRNNFGDHLVLGEEGGIIRETSSDYLWCIDPLDGTTNFAHCYPSFAVSVGVLFRGKPAAASVVEFVGGPMCWNTHTFSATAGGGAFCNGQKVHVSQTHQVEQSLLVTGFGYEHDDAWATNMELFKEFTDISSGVRRLGAAAVDMCHVALGIVEAYWEYRLKPWDMAAGVLVHVYFLFSLNLFIRNGMFCKSGMLLFVARVQLHVVGTFFLVVLQIYSNSVYASNTRGEHMLGKERLCSLRKSNWYEVLSNSLV
ncbi:phosphatase IMPL1, chloroplastic-like isoform X2 [Ziziphus jujuba]|uniref:Inositol-1-monophosphatase n=1 Tax=Ziziphus jujuba TaxID=326968 RepID=A0ABM4ABV8_ZIZJJ|nr:phosphatase IMPL1, chloroplastic-like isoform X2 [Ziziphus jujuba]